MPAAADLMPPALAEPQPHAGRAVAAAAAQITLALQEAQQPVQQLGASVGRIITNAASIRNLTGTGQQMRGALEELRQDAMRATIALQFYDRMTQHLTHLHDFLEGASELLERAPDGCADAVPGTAQALRVAGWEELRDRLCSRLITESQRQRLQGDLPAEGGMADTSASGADRPLSRDSIELF